MVMTDKAYIVANEQQEHEVLKKLERDGFKWWGGDKLTKWSPSRILHVEFPYILLAQETFVTWSRINEVCDLEKYEIVFDGRKEEQMSDKYVVSQEFMNELEEWKNNLVSSKRIYPEDISELYSENVIRHWWQGDGGGTDANNRFIAIIRWVNGEDVFEVKSKKWVVRSKETDVDSHYGYIKLGDFALVFNRYDINEATHFDTKEEAESWANSHQEVLEVVDV